MFHFPWKVLTLSPVYILLLVSYLKFCLEDYAFFSFEVRTTNQYEHTNMTFAPLLTFAVILGLIQNDSYFLSRNKIRMFVGVRTSYPLV